MPKKQSSRSTARENGKSTEAVVLGVPLLLAEQAERRRLARRGPRPSPLPRQKYRFAGGETDVLDPKRVPLDGALADVCRRFRKASARDRPAMRAAIGMEEFYTLLDFARRAAVFAMREESSDWIDAGLSAVAMVERERVDWRDELVALGTLYHAAGRIGLDPDQMFRDATALAEPGTAELMEEFPNRPPRNKRLSAWGFAEVGSGGEVRLVRGRLPRKGTGYDLLAIAAEIADHLRADRYRPSSTDFGERMPRVWLETHDNTALDQVRKEVRTGVSISAELRRTKGVPSGSQHFVVFLQEMKTDEAARQLLTIARGKKPQSFFKVELAAGRLFCLIVARSCWQGVPPYETAKSVTRFAKPIGDILRSHAAK